MSNICSIAVIYKDGKILRGLRHYTADKYKEGKFWTIPGGRCDEGETLEETLKREIYEEVGITDIKIRDYLGMLEGAKEGDVVHIYLCLTQQEPKLMEPEKFSRWEWFEPEYLPTDHEMLNLRAFEFIKEKLSALNLD